MKDTIRQPNTRSNTRLKPKHNRIFPLTTYLTSAPKDAGPGPHFPWPQNCSQGRDKLLLWHTIKSKWQRKERNGTERGPKRGLNKKSEAESGRIKIALKLPRGHPQWTSNSVLGAIPGSRSVAQRNAAEMQK